MVSIEFVLLEVMVVLDEIFYVFVVVGERVSFVCDGMDCLCEMDCDILVVFYVCDKSLL